jgi:glycosyltransferase involved in cell wall biosynthesis
MIRMCMITHDQIERGNPRADLIRFISLGETLARHSIDVVFVTLNDKAVYERSYYRNSEVYKIPILSRIKLIQLLCFSVFLLPTMFQAKQNGRFDIIFVNSIVSIPSVLIFKWLSAYGIIQFDLMGILSEERFLRRPKNLWVSTAKKILIFMENFLLSRADFVTTINEKHKQMITNRITRPVYVIRDGVHEEVLKRASVHKISQPSISKIVLIFVGQLGHFRLDTLFNIMPDLLSKSPNLELWIVGSGPQSARYIGMVESLGSRERVIFEGYIPHDKIFDYIEMADIAYSEDWSTNGFPMKIFEYMAMGKPIVAQSTESIKELLVDHLSALLYENEKELKEKILALAKNSELRKEIGGNAKQMMHHHTWEKRVEALSSIYAQYIARSATI